MQILITAFGSRGDVQPVLALAHGLAQAGHAVTIAAGSDFRGWVENEGFTYGPLDINIQQFMSSEAGRDWTEGHLSPVQEARSMKRAMQPFFQRVQQDLIPLAAGAEVFISNLPGFGFVAALAEKHSRPHLLVLLSPLTPAAEAASNLIPTVPRLTTPLNLISGYLGIYFTCWVFSEAFNGFRAQLGLSRWNYRDYLRAWNSTPTLYGVSPLVMPPARRWGPHLSVTGYWFHDGPTEWQPPQALADFLARGERPVYIGFGSMAHKNPQDTLRLIVEALQQAGRRGVVHNGWAGLSSDQLPSTVYLLDNAPHDWLFPQMAAVVHHGGSGTTAAGLRAGVPSMVVPHMADQPYWGRRVYELGVGVKPVPRRRLKSSTLAAALEGLTGDETLRAGAAALGRQIRAERGVENAVAALHRALGL